VLDELQAKQTFAILCTNFFFWPTNKLARCHARFVSQDCCRNLIYKSTLLNRGFFSSVSALGEE
jgi:hypothetical protein